jgi:hypothetical protein
MDIHQDMTESTQDGRTSRKGGGRNSIHPVQVRGDHVTSGERCPGVCQLKDAGPQQGTERED